MSTTHVSLAKTLVELLPFQATSQKSAKAKALKVALEQVIPAFSQTHPEWTATLFDDQFLGQTAKPLLDKYVNEAKLPAAVELAEIWDRQLGPASDNVRSRRLAEVMPVATHFLIVLQTKL
jgi:hypothetical protein